jgi:hypothetical protein
MSNSLAMKSAGKPAQIAIQFIAHGIVPENGWSHT